MSSIDRFAAISFDLDDTLWPSASLIARAEEEGRAWFEQHAPKALAHLHPERRSALRRRALDDLPDNDVRRSDMRYLRERLYALALSDAGYDTALARSAFAVFDAARQRVEPYPDAVAVLQHLSQRYALIAVTNGSADLKRIGWSQYFKLLVSPSEAGAAKPDSRIYHYACEALGVDPGRVLHVGDDAKLDVEAARNAGLQVAWINRLQAVWPLATPAPLSFTDLHSLTAWLER